MESIKVVLAFGALLATINYASATFSKGDDDDRRYIRVTSINGIGGYNHGGHHHGGYSHGSYSPGGYSSRGGSPAGSYGHGRRVSPGPAVGGYGSSGHVAGGYGPAPVASGYGSGHRHGGYGPAHGSDSYGAGSHGHYTTVIVKQKGDKKGHKGFLKDLHKGVSDIGKGIHQKVSHFGKGIHEEVSAWGKDLHKEVSHIVDKGKGLVGLDKKYEFVGYLRPEQNEGYGGSHHGASHHHGSAKGHGASVSSYNQSNKVY